MHLLVVTDHRFIEAKGSTYDTYCFDRDFFSDYQAVFSDVTVAARRRSVAELPLGSRVADGDGVCFHPLPDFRSLRWTVDLPAVRRHLVDAVENADAVCVRIPSVAGRVAAHLAYRRNKPVMFELVGDPAASLRAALPGILGAALSRWEAAEVRWIVRHAVTGTYVSQHHLQARYPATRRAATDSVSSIRLPHSWITRPRDFEDADLPLTLILVASLVPVKRHDLLIRAVAASVASGTDVYLNLVGDGPLRGDLERLAGRLNVQERIAFHGHVADRDELRRLLDASDVFAMPSSSEGMPRSLIEGMARGLPGIGSNSGGIAEILDGQQIIDSDDPEIWGEMITSLQGAREDLANFSRKSFEVAAGFEQDVLAGRRRRILQHLAAQATKEAV